jgi:hypothetical protein
MRKLTVRAAVAVVLGLLIGTMMYGYYARWSRLGVDAYLDYESVRFDRRMAHPHVGFALMEWVLLVLILVVVYELIVAAVWKFAKARQS